MPPASRPWRTRFAPAPTGYLHLGHLVNAIYVWGIARAFGGAVVLRIEDHDGTRSRREFEQALLDDLEWIGLAPDVPDMRTLRVGASAYRQSDSDQRYREALDSLESCQLVYACGCSRREIAELVGDKAGMEVRYPGTCRRRTWPDDVVARRVLITEAAQEFFDVRHGALVQHPARQCGDVMVRDRLGQWTYQFAVVVDDMVHDIDLVVRGDDLLESTGRQVQLAKMLGRERPPLFYHHPLVLRSDGRKLSKANRDTSLRELRERGATPAMLLGKAAHAVGLQPRAQPLTLADATTLVFEQLVQQGAAEVMRYLTTPANPRTTSMTHWGPLNPSVRSS